jgi:hypothetical protein
MHGPLDRTDPSGLKFTFTIQHLTMKQIEARQPGALAATIPNLRILGKDDIRVSRPTPCCWCAKVYETRYFDFVLETLLPTDGLGVKYNSNGWFELAGHEMRRYKSYKLGYDKYLDPAPAIAKKCGTICFQAPGVAKNLLQTYVNQVFTLARISFQNYTFLENADIEDENNHARAEALADVTLLFDAFLIHHAVRNPWDADWPPCPVGGLCGGKDTSS